MPKIPQRIISLDTETTGIDLYHGARPFLVTICDEQGENTWWEWGVDPLTRMPEIPDSDLEEIQEEIEAADLIVLQNTKFDATALWTIMPEFEFPWHKVRDTLIAGHLLASNHPHDLTSMAIEYLGINIEKYEQAVKQAVNEARRLARSEHPEWRIAGKGLPDMPSAKETPWKYDLWLPRAIDRDSTVTQEYANADSAVTIALWLKQEQLIDKGILC